MVSQNVAFAARHRPDDCSAEELFSHGHPIAKSADESPANEIREGKG